MSSTLRFKVGDLAKTVNCPLNPGWVVEIIEVGPFSAGHIFSDGTRCFRPTDYVVRIISGECLGVESIADDKHLTPYPDPSEFDRDTEMWEDFKRLTGYQTPREVTCE